MDPSASSPNKSLTQSTKPTFACVRCSERKVKCNRQNPCGSCVRHNAQCIFRSPKPSRRKRPYVDDELVKRLESYEALLQEHGIEPKQNFASTEAENHSGSAPFKVRGTIRQLPTPTSIVSESQATTFKPQLLCSQEGTKFVDNNLWSRVAEEMIDGESAWESDLTDDESDSGTSRDDFAYVLNWKTSKTVSSHPPSSLIRLLWQTFVKNVNPVAKFVHIPSLQPLIEKAIANIEHIPRGFEALMFAIYSMAVLSLTEEECKGVLEEPRVIVLSHFVAATKAALSRARFMSNTSIVVMQALMLHILSVRDIYNPRALWSLTGLAIRIAEGMGMRIDGTLLGLSPFEIEIRRRIWWQLRMHDSRAAELCGQAKFRDFEIDETTPKKPANVNDSDLYPAMTQAAVESTKPTEMMWIVLRSELASCAAIQKAEIRRKGKLGASHEEYAAMDDLKAKDDFIAKIEDMIETKFLRFCDPSEPLQLLVLLGARCAIDLIRFTAHHPRRWAQMEHVPSVEKEFVWRTVLQLLERYNMMQSSLQLRHFAWNMPYFIQWHAFIHVLDTLRTDPLNPDAMKAWRIIDTMYEINSKILLSANRPIFVAVGNLCLKASSARATALTKEGGGLSNPPEYITKLQEQRQGAKAKREAVLARNKEQAAFGGGKRPAAMDMDVIWPSTNSRPADKPTKAHLEQSQPLYSMQGSTGVGDDALWFDDALGNDFFADGAANTMSLDIATDYWLNTSNDEVIDWAQWDAWLGEVDHVR